MHPVGGYARENLCEWSPASPAKLCTWLVRLAAAPAGHEPVILRRRRHIDLHIHRWPAPSRHRDAQRSRNSRRLDRIELPHTSRHEKALEEAEECRDSGPEEATVENSQPSPAQIKMVNAEGAQKQSQQDAHNLVAAHRFIVLIKDSLRVGIRDGAHGSLSLLCQQYTHFRYLRFHIAHGCRSCASINPA